MSLGAGAVVVMAIGCGVMAWAATTGLARVRARHAIPRRPVAGPGWGAALGPLLAGAVGARAALPLLTDCVAFGAGPGLLRGSRSCGEGAG